MVGRFEQHDLGAPFEPVRGRESRYPATNDDHAPSFRHGVGHALQS
jgi:hypothetical protein